MLLLVVLAMPVLAGTASIVFILVIWGVYSLFNPGHNGNTGDKDERDQLTGLISGANDPNTISGANYRG